MKKIKKKSRVNTIEYEGCNFVEDGQVMFEKKPYEQNLEGGDSSVSHFTHSVMSDSLQPHRLQHARPPCPSPTPGVYPNSCPLSW